MIKILFFGMIANKVGKQSTTLQGDMVLGDVIAAAGWLRGYKTIAGGGE